MALLVLPACVLNSLYDLIFAVLLSPQVGEKAFRTVASANAINLANVAVGPGTSFLVAFALGVVGLKQLIWSHSRNCKIYLFIFLKGRMAH